MSSRVVSRTSWQPASERSTSPASQRLLGWIVPAIVTLHVALLGYSAAMHSPVVDEPAHLAAGIADWRMGGFEMFKVNPPLMRMVAALPAVVINAPLDWTAYYVGVGARGEFPLGDALVKANGSRIFCVIVLGRLAVIVFAVLGALTCHRWASELYGDGAGIMALVLWCFCPNVLAYGQLITTDVAAASVGLAANYFFWKWLNDQAWERAILAAIALGFAELSKLTWLVLVAVWPILFVVWSLTSTVRPRAEAATPGTINLRRIGAVMLRLRQALPSLQFSLILFGAAFVVNLGYGFTGMGTRVKDIIFVSRLFGCNTTDVGTHGPPGNRFGRTWAGRARLPFPKPYIEGIDLQRRDFECGMPSYLRGHWKDHGWWYWYLYALSVKVPLGTWGLFLLAVAVRVAGWWGCVRGRRAAKSIGIHPDPSFPPDEQGTITTWRDEIVLLAPAAVVLVFVSSQTGFSRYLRYALPVLPFVFIWISSVVRNLWIPRRNATGGVHCRRWRIATVAALLLSWSVGSSLWYAPHWMSYFNELAGGPMGGPAHLIDAQVDWGQDLLYLKKWLDAHREARPLGMVYFGPVDPRLSHIEFSLPPKAIRLSHDRARIAKVPQDLRPGRYAISVNFLYGYPGLAPDGHGQRVPLHDAFYSYFRRFQPVATAGYSIYIYDLTASDIERARRPAEH